MGGSVVELPLTPGSGPGEALRLRRPFLLPACRQRAGVKGGFDTRS
jgi:hypothetical protein